MARGDQIYVMRNLMGVPYEHHGIDAGDGTVIHYRKVGEAEIARTTWQDFSWGNPVYVKRPAVALIANHVIERAESRLGERQYDLFFNNCEHFANWCKTGRNQSEQLNNFGLRLDQIQLPQVGQLTGKAARDESPVAILQLFETALANLRIATQTLLPAYHQAETDRDTWQRVAQKALTQGREDLARAALHRKREASQKVKKLRSQLTDLSNLQRQIQQDHEIAQQRLT